MNKRRIRILQQRGAKMMVKKVIFKMENISVGVLVGMIEQRVKN